MKLFSFFLCTVFFVSVLSAQNADIDLLRKINVHRNQKLDCSFKFITNTVSPVHIGVPVGLIATGLISHNKTTLYNGLEASAAFIVNSGLTGGLKIIINRPRPFKTYPDIVKLSDGGSPSFPSGHTSSAFAAATSLSLMYPKWYVIAPSFTWACLAGYSRMHLGVHYPSDVLGGIIVGAGSAYLCHVGKKWLQKKQKNSSQKGNVSVSL